MNKIIIIEGGRVHNVGYRPFLLAKAWELAIPNYSARNIKENGIEIVEVSLGGEEGQINEFIGFIKRNYPSEANVSDVREGEPPGRVMPIDKYDRVLAAEQQNTMVQTGLVMVDMQKQTVDMQKQTVEKLDSFHHDTIQKFDTMDVKYDKVSDKLDKMDKTLDRLTNAILKLAEKSAK